MTRSMFMASTVLAVVTALMSSVGSLAQPSSPFPKPTGPHAVGTSEWLWVDQKRSDPYTKDASDRRRLPIQVIYPADVTDGAKIATYIRTPAEFSANSSYRAIQHLTTNAYVDVPVAKAASKYPVLIYNHGAGASRFTGTFITEQLASHGYIVASVEHPGLNGSSAFPNGSPFSRDTLPISIDTKGLEPRAAFEASGAYLGGVHGAIWIEDAKFVLDELERLNRNRGPFQGKLDLDRIGMLGSSFGGALAVEMSRIDPRVKAAVNHDGSLYIGNVKSVGTNRPFMLIRSDRQADRDAPRTPEFDGPDISAIFSAWDSTAMATSRGGAFYVEIARAHHLSFIDHPLIFRWDTTRLAGKRGHEVITAYTLAFFEQYLKGKASALLDGPPTQYPEVRRFLFR